MKKLLYVVIYLERLLRQKTMGKLFGTDGVRGIANEKLSVKLAHDLGKAGAFVLGKKKKPTIIIGRDTRLSGDMLKSALASGILSYGGTVIDVGTLPTPAVAFLTMYYKADAGIVISASHNPFEYNGIKFFESRGFKLDDALEDEIEKVIEDGIDNIENAPFDQVGRMINKEEEALNAYSDFLLSKIDISLEGVKIVLDCANGAAYKVGPLVYNKLGADVIVIGDDPDGININKDCGSTHTELLREHVKKEGATMGLAFDGDADRLIVVDESGEEVDGDRTICICAKLLKEKGLLKNNIVTCTVMSNLGFHKYMEKIGVEVVDTKVGDKYVLESMLKTGSIIGGEQSGHIIFLNHTTTGDGVLSSLQFTQAVMERGKSVSELASEIEIFPQVLINAKVKEENKMAYLEDGDVQNAIRQAEKDLSGNGRVLIRTSGTEPLIRVMLEGQDLDSITVMAKNISDIIVKKYS